MTDSAAPTEPTNPAAAPAPAAPAEPAAVAPVEPEPAVEPVVEPAAEAVSTDEPKTFSQDYVEKLRREAADARTKGNEKAEKAAKEAAEKAAAETQQALVEKWGRELGLIKDEDATPQPDDIIAKLTAERDDVAKRESATAKKLRELTEHNALRSAADAHDGDFAQLSDSKDLSRKLDALDHSADDYAAQVEAAVSAALQANPKFRKDKPRTAPGRSGADLSAGNGASKPIGNDSSIEELIESRRKRRGRK